MIVRLFLQYRFVALRLGMIVFRQSACRLRRIAPGTRSRHAGRRRSVDRRFVCNGPRRGNVPEPHRPAQDWTASLPSNLAPQLIDDDAKRLDVLSTLRFPDCLEQFAMRQHLVRVRNPTQVRRPAGKSWGSVNARSRTASPSTGYHNRRHRARRQEDGRCRHLAIPCHHSTLHLRPPRCARSSSGESSQTFAFPPRGSNSRADHAALVRAGAGATDGDRFDAERQRWLEIRCVVRQQRFLL
jgi:hypothetical protein